MLIALTASAYLVVDRTDSIHQLRLIGPTACTKSPFCFLRRPARSSVCASSWLDAGMSTMSEPSFRTGQRAWMSFETIDPLGLQIFLNGFRWLRYIGASALNHLAEPSKTLVTGRENQAPDFSRQSASIHCRRRCTPYGGPFDMAHREQYRAIVLCDTTRNGQMAFASSKAVRTLFDVSEHFLNPAEIEAYSAAESFKKPADWVTN
jgi:hypothetical protein